MKTVTRYLTGAKIGAITLGTLALLGAAALTPQARPLEREIAPRLVDALAPAPTPAPTATPTPAPAPAAVSAPVQPSLPPVAGGGNGPQIPAGSLPDPTNIPAGAVLVTIAGQGQKAVDPQPGSSGPKVCCSTAGGQPVVVPNDLNATISASGNHGFSNGQPLGYNGQTVTLSANVYGGWSGVAPSFRWSNGAAGQSIAVTGPGSYSVTVTEVNAGGVITATSNTVSVVFTAAPTPPPATPTPPVAATPTPH